VHLPEPHRQLVAPVVAGAVSTRVKQLQLQTAPAWLRGIKLSDDQLLCAGNLRAQEPVEASLDGADGLQLPVCCCLDLVVGRAKGAPVQAAGEARQAGQDEKSNHIVGNT
jgi:hypothetical protein